MSQNSKEQAQAQLNSVIAMVNALSVDYYRMEQLRDQINDKDAFIDDGSTMDEAREELAELEEAANGNENEEEAREAIQNDALSVDVRSDWHAPGDKGDAMEYRILLCTGGPAVQIIGELDQCNQPCNAMQS